MMASYNLKAVDGKLSFQSNGVYKGKIISCVILAAAAFIIPLVWPLNYEVSRFIMCIGVICGFYAVYDFLFKVNLTYVFDERTREVYLKAPGLYSKKLMSFEEVYILQETTNNNLQYVISNKKDRFGRNYAVSDYFPDTKKGRKRQEVFETEILDAINDMLFTVKAPNI